MAKISANGDKVLVKLVRVRINPNAKMAKETTNIAITSQGRVLMKYKGEPRNAKPVTINWHNTKQIITGDPEIIRKEVKSWNCKGFKRV